jgi:endonuclease YncB( thermonuclease family)
MSMFDFRRRDEGPWRRPEPNWHKRPVRTRSLIERLALLLGFFVLGAGVAAAILNYHRLPELTAYLGGTRSVASVNDRVPAAHPNYYKPVHPSALPAYRAVDGDSLRNESGDIRLLGIDAPELSQRCRRDGKEWACGRAAHERLKQLVAKNDVRCEANGRDRYGRTLAHCSSGGTDIGEVLVREGLALNFMQGGYERHERDARAARRGIWAGEFDLPQEHRRQPRAQR